MKSERMEMLEGLLKSGISPILLENFPASIFTDAVILESTCGKEDLTGHYEEIAYCPPEWYKKLENLDEKILVISNINKIPSLEPYNERLAKEELNFIRQTILDLFVFDKNQQWLAGCIAFLLCCVWQSK